MPKSHPRRNAAKGLNGRFSFVFGGEFTAAAGFAEKPQKWL